MNINWDVTYPIYDFISDPTKKAQIKAAVERYITSKKIDVIELVPLYHGWKRSKYNDNFGAGYEGLNYLKSNGYSILGIECYILKNQVSGSVPLYHGWKKSKYNDNFGAGTEGLNSLMSNGYTILGIEGYVYSSQYTLNTVLLYHGWMKSKYNDSFGAGSDGLNSLISNGYTILGNEGAVYPAN